MKDVVRFPSLTITIQVHQLPRHHRESNIPVRDTQIVAKLVQCLGCLKILLRYWQVESIEDFSPLFKSWDLKVGNPASYQPYVVCWICKTGTVRTRGHVLLQYTARQKQHLHKSVGFMVLGWHNVAMHNNLTGETFGMLHPLCVATLIFGSAHFCISHVWLQYLWIALYCHHLCSLQSWSLFPIGSTVS